MGTIINESPGMPQIMYNSKTVVGDYKINKDGFLISREWNEIARFNGPMILSAGGKNYLIVFVDGQIRSRERI